jgi:hypothetical protein
MPDRPKPQSRRNVGPGKQYADFDVFEKDLQAWYDEAAAKKKARKDEEKAQIALEQRKREGKAGADECVKGGKCNHVMHGDDGSGYPTHTRCSKCGATHRA